MSTISSKLVIIGVLFLFTLVSGLAVSHGGKPYNAALFTLHKLAALAAVILIGMTVKQLWSGGDARALLELGLTIVSGLLFLALFVTGAILSIKSQLPMPVLRIHQIAPLLSVAASAVVLYLLAGKKV
ncbi:MAG: hypothetical protein JXA42_25505 [Anaerolineales bacterium]|nr:hypothetical protein [Anaerolineales bacterium]